MYNNENVLILGYGITGVSVLKCLSAFNVNIYIYDNDIKKLENETSYDFKIFKEEDLYKIDFIIKSPGINPNNKILLKARELGIIIKSDLELFYEITKCKNIVAITGTNGKTTTTSLISQILSGDRKTYCVGNIGKGVLDVALEADEDDYVVIEASSFQLEDTINFRPMIAAITNVTSDHLDWHVSVDNYINAKFKIFKNQNDKDYTVLNANDSNLKNLSLNSNIYYFSLNDNINFGTYVKENKIYFKSDVLDEQIMDISDIKIPGKHNIENVLCAITIAKILGISSELIKKSISNFMGVEHRIEFVKEVNGIKYYNDSKGTNPDSTIMAINAINKNILLIAGGYDKNSDYANMLEVGRGKIKYLILLGETASKIEKVANSMGYKIYIVKDMEKAINLAKNISIEGDTVLLSPACASWDMYSSYEERGNHFKKIVNELI
ncbi:MAG: UDP-N-acetylmuramoyl-L-alanine--D-glutamate ligase [Peptoniphilaceae bacterium]